MDRFSGLLRRKSKALRVFEDARDRLGSVVAELQSMINDSKGEIDSLKGRVSTEEQAILFATREMAAASNTIQKINELIK